MASVASRPKGSGLDPGADAESPLLGLGGVGKAVVGLHSSVGASPRVTHGVLVFKLHDSVEAMGRDGYRSFDSDALY